MKRKDILFLLIPMLVIVILWVVFNIYHSYASSTIPTNLNMQILSISPNFDLKTIDQIKTRKIINPITDLGSQAESLVTPTPTPTIPISPSGAIQASQGGEVLQ